MSADSPQHPAVQRALENLAVHPRLLAQHFAPDPVRLAELVGTVPVLSPFEGRDYAHVRAVLDWDHQLPSQMMMLRIYCAHQEHEARLIDIQFKKRETEIEQDDLFPEFDVPDFGEFDAGEYYVASVDMDTWALEDLRFFSDWRREIRGTIARAALAAVRKREAFRDAYKRRRSDALGGAVVVGWAPPALAHSAHWAVEVWLVTDFDGASGSALVFMVDGTTHQVTREYETEIHIA